MPDHPDRTRKSGWAFAGRFLKAELKLNIGSALFVSCLGMGLIFFMEWRQIIPKAGGSIKLSAMQSGVEITYPTSRGHSESLSVVSVPAYRMATLTGIALHPGETIEVTASGIVSTSAMYSWRDLDLATESRASSLTTASDVVNFVRETQFNQNANPDWRDPDGNRLTLREEYISPNMDLHNAHELYKLFPGRDYGLLLGCILPGLGPKSNNLKVIGEVLKARKLLFPIGEKTTIQCLKDEGHKMTLHFPTAGEGEPIADIEVDGNEGQLILLVNDIVVTPELLDKFSVFKKATKEEQAFYEQTKERVFQSTLAKKMAAESRLDEFNLFASELWYWDNKGIFTVVVKKSGEE
jgi:hypothetical protein